MRDGDRESGCAFEARDVLDARRVGDDAVLLACINAVGGGSLVRLRMTDEGIEPVEAVSLGTRRPALLAVGRGVAAFLADDRVLWYAPMPRPSLLPVADAWRVLAGRDIIDERSDRFGTSGLGFRPDGRILLRLDMASRQEFVLPGEGSALPADDPREPRRLRFAEAARTGAPWSVPGVRVQGLHAAAAVGQEGVVVPVWSQVRVGAEPRFARLGVVAHVDWSLAPEPAMIDVGGHSWLLPCHVVAVAVDAPALAATSRVVAALTPGPCGASAVGAFVHVQLIVFDADGALLGATDVVSVRSTAAATAR
ncbi:MAG: hypothetical protein U1E73_06650 [Planctomycetota bacterium]